MTFIVQQVHADQRPPEGAIPLQPLSQEVQAAGPQRTVKRSWHCFLPAACTCSHICIELVCTVACEENSSTEAVDEVNNSEDIGPKGWGCKS